MLKWGGRANRSNDLAEALGLTLIELPWNTRRAWLVPLRYAVQWFASLRALRQQLPGHGVIVAQHTQPFASLAAWWHARRTGGHLVLDCHNGPIVGRFEQSRLLRPIHRRLFARADAVLVHNEAVRRIAVEEQHLPGRFVVLHDPLPPHFTPGEPNDSSYALSVCSFASDEPIQALWDACEACPEIDVLVTGHPSRLPSALRRSKPANVTLTGFMPHDEFVRTLRAASVAVALSNYEAVLMRAHHEALAAGVPMVTTDQPVIRSYLADAAVYVEHRSRSIARGLREAMAERASIRENAIRVAEQRRVEWSREAERVFREVFADSR